MRVRCAVCLLALFAVAQISCVSTPAPAIETMVRTAATPADHRRIAKYYRDQAAERRAKGAEHTRLSELYGGRQLWGAAFADYQSEHCDQVATSEDNLAAQYELLATQHERLANQ